MDGNSYVYWKVRMKAFLKYLDERVWLFVENGRERPTTPINKWNTAQKEVASFNSKAMNAIFRACLEFAYFVETKIFFTKSTIDKGKS